MYTDRMPSRPSFSDQLRNAVEGCGTSRYALAKQLGVSESTLSRFVAGKQGLTLATLDKLTRLLGLELVCTVQQVPRPTPRGRKKPGAKKPEQRKAMMKKQDWTQFAKVCAADAHENWFESRRGTWYIKDLDVVVLYNNNPYAQYPTLRDEELAEFLSRLRAEGIQELAYATYPEDGYTYAMVIDASRDREQFLADVMQDIMMETFRRDDSRDSSPN
jgi:transcriptional regulator with XRE-family HTH domain